MVRIIICLSLLGVTACADNPQRAASPQKATVYTSGSVGSANIPVTTTGPNGATTNTVYAPR